jgi:hypothetical protein
MSVYINVWIRFLPKALSLIYKSLEQFEAFSFRRKITKSKGIMFAECFSGGFYE